MRGFWAAVERHGFDDKAPRRDGGDQALDGAELADGLTPLLVAKEAGKPHAGVGILDGPTTEHVRHTQGHSRQVRGRDGAPGSQHCGAVDHCRGRRNCRQSNARHAGAAQSERALRLDRHFVAPHRHESIAVEE